MHKHLALGTVQFGLDYGIANQTGQVPLAEARTILSLAAAHDIDTLDTAIGYGESEATLGLIGVHTWRIISKLPAIPDYCTDVNGWVNTQIEASLARLLVDHLDVILLHRPDQLFGPHGKQLVSALENLKTKRRVHKIGVSIYDPEELARLLDTLPCDLVQAPLNLIDRRIVESGWAQQLQDNGIELHVRSVFLQGLLLMNRTQRPAKFARWQPIWAAWDDWLTASNLTPLEACLRYALNAEAIDKVIVGVDSLSQLEEILTTMTEPLKSLPIWPQAVEHELITPSRWSQL